MIRRNIPFGYTMINGEIVVNEPEAADVRHAFALYLQGASLQDIANVMTVPYNEGVGWDKHKIKRILDNSKYTGSGGHQPLIDRADFAVANKLKSDKNTSIPLPCPQDIQALKAATFCDDCGKRFIRKLKRGTNARWRCLTQCCNNKTSLHDDDVKIAVTTMLNSIIKNPSVLQVQPPCKDSLAIIKLQNKLNYEMSKSKPAIEHTQSLLLSLAAEKYASCVDTHSTLALRAIFENHEPANQFDCGFFDSTVSKVLIADNGSVSLRLKNGQTLPIDLL